MLPRTSAVHIVVVDQRGEGGGGKEAMTPRPPWLRNIFLAPLAHNI